MLLYNEYNNKKSDIIYKMIPHKVLLEGSKPAMRECIFHFKLIRDNHTELLRALIILGPGKQPQLQDFLTAFKGMGYNVTLENERELIFASVNPKDPYKLDVTKLEIKGEGEDKAAQDAELRAILENLIKPSW